MTTSAGATGVFSTDSSQRVLAISGFMATEGFRKRQGFTFVIRSSALISLALEEGRGATIEWQKWKEKVTVFDRSCRSIVHVEGSRVFTLERPLGGEANFVVYDFSPGARKERGNPPYTSQHLRLADTPPIPQTHCWFEISGNTLVLLDVRDSNFVLTRPVFRLVPELSTFRKHHRRHLLCLNIHSEL